MKKSESAAAKYALEGGHAPAHLLPHSESSCVKFRVHDVEPSAVRLGDLSAGTWFEGTSWSESAVDRDVPPVKGTGANSPSLLAVSVYEAFYKHHPVKLNPNAVWLTIAQGFARFVNFFPEELRGKFVTHHGKENITIADPNEPRLVNWPARFADFSAEIEARVGSPTVALLQANFSNSTPVDILASHVTLMDTMQSYFEYGMMCGCGIPSVELQGTVADWELLRTKAEGLRAFEIEATAADGGRGGGLQSGARQQRSPQFLKKWLDELLPVLDHFVAAARGAPDLNFFGSCVNLVGASGIMGLPITGWIAVFYPYLREGLVENWALGQWRESYEAALASGMEGISAELADASRQGRGGKGGRGDVIWQGPGSGGRRAIGGRGIHMRDFPSGLARAPVKLNDLTTGKSVMVEVLGGLATLHQDKGDGSLEVSFKYYDRFISLPLNLLCLLHAGYRLGLGGPFKNKWMGLNSIG